MIKKIKGSIGLKTFISMMSLLMVCCVLIYGLVLYFLPKNYQTELESQFTTDFQSLIENLETNGWENSSQAILTFSMKNNASVQVTDENQAEVFEVNTAVSEEMGSAGKSLGTTAQFSYENKTYTVNAIASFVAVAQSYDVLLMTVAAIAFLLSFGTSSLIAQMVSDSLTQKISDTLKVSVLVSPFDWGTVSFFGICLVVLATVLSAYPLLRTNPKNILSQMN